MNEVHRKKDLTPVLIPVILVTSGITWIACLDMLKNTHPGYCRKEEDPWYPSDIQQV
jgi:hypothetical protein